VQLDDTPDQAALRESVRAVLERECAIGDVRALVEARVRDEDLGDKGVDQRLWRTTVGLDWPALTVPEAHGGMGYGYVELAVLAEELGRAIAPGPLGTTVTQLAPALREMGDGARLAAVASGELTGTLALAEETGWLLDSLTATATLSGDRWTLSGRKRHVLEAGGVDEYAVVVRVDSQLALALVSAADVTVEPARALDPTRRIGTVALDGVQVASDRVRPIDRSALEGLIEEVTLAIALDNVGCCQAIFDTSIAYARDRVQFGVPIGSFQAVKHKLVNMFVALERARATAYFAVACIAEDDPRRSVATAMAKAAAGDCQRLVASDGIQLLGGIGYTWEHDQHLYVTRAKADEALLGGASHHRKTVAATLGV
jgi:alkylation response protein AidB-like acyl-CoA dehydrogenase